MNYLEYYTPRTTAAMHGTGITSKLPMNKYTRVTGGGQGGRALGARLYKGLLVLPATLLGQPSSFSYARILQFIAPASYHSGSKIFNHHLQLYAGKQPMKATKVAIANVISLWTNVWVKLYKQSLLRYTQVRITRKHTQPNGATKVKGVAKKHQLPHVNKL